MSKTSNALICSSTLLAAVLAFFSFSAVAHEVALPAGTVIPVRLKTTASSATSRPGDVVLAAVRSDIVQNGRVVIPAGSEVRGQVVSARRPGKVSGQAYLAVSFDSVTVRGRSYKLSTRTLAAVGRKNTKKDAIMIGGGTIGGALLGGLIDGKGGAGKGALIGGAAGTGAVLTTRGKDVAFPAGGRYRLRLSSSYPS